VSDDEVVVFRITVPVGGSQVTARTLSYAAGGFDPVLSLFGPVGPLFLLTLDDNSGSTCGLAPVCLDAEISTFLPGGDYWIALTEADNFPNGPQFLDGFSRAGEGNFTGGPFTDFLGNPRTGEFLVEISGVEAAPEPRAPALAALAALWWLKRRRERLRSRAGGSLRRVESGQRP
jgi:hypothetical protein